MFGMIPFDHRDSSLFDMFDNFERSFFGANNTASSFRTDIRDEGDKFILEAELPGFKKEDIKLDLKDGILTIAAQHSTENEEKKDSYIRRERKYGSFSRSFDVSGIQEDRITAAYNNGVLELTLPKAQPVVPAARQIDIL